MFLSRHSRTYQSAVMVNPYLRYIITGTILLAAILIWWFGLYMWSRNKVRHVKTEIVTLQKKETDLIAARKTIVQLQQEVDDLQQKVNDYRIGTTVQAQQEQLVAILNGVSSSGIALNGYTIENHKEKGWYVSHIVQAEVAGNYDQLLKFFDSIKECKKMIQCDQLQCSIGKSGECVMSAQLKMTVPLRTVIQNKES